MIKNISILVFTIVCNISVAKEEGTNPLAPILPVPTYQESTSETNEERIIREYNELAEKRKAENLNTVNEREVEYSDNVLNTLHEEQNPSPLSPLADKKLKFNDFHENDYTPEQTSRLAQSSDSGVIVLIGFGILIVVSGLIIFIIKNK